MMVFLGFVEMCRQLHSTFGGLGLVIGGLFLIFCVVAFLAAGDK